jgi:hypothetical protein
MTTYRSVFWLNTVSLLLVIALIVSAKFSGLSVALLFLPPFTPNHPNVGLLTHTFQLLCSVPAIICAFSFGLLKTFQPRRKENLFILCSALLTGAFLINEIFRVHIILLGAGVPKLVTIFVYAIVGGLYGLAFRRTIQSTPYILLLTGMGLLFFAITVDSLHLNGKVLPSLLEGVPKLFSELNIALYFWYVCYQEVLRSSTVRSD